MPLSGEGCCTCPFTITVGQVQWTPRWNHSDATLFLSAAEPPVLMRASYSAKMVTPLVAYCPWKQETQSVQTGAIEHSEMRLFVVALAEVSPLGGKRTSNPPEMWGWKAQLGRIFLLYWNANFSALTNHSLLSVATTWMYFCLLFMIYLPLDASTWCFSIMGYASTSSKPLTFFLSKVKLIKMVSG